MRKTIFVLCVLLAASAYTPALRAQDNNTQSTAKPAEPPHFYHLKLVVQELDADGKITNSRSYFTTVSTDKYSHNSIRTTSRVPVPAGAGGGYRYEDVGINFDVHGVHEYGRQLSLDIQAVVDGYVSVPAGSAVQGPVLRHNQWEAPVLIPIDKPAVIFTSDSPDSKGVMQVVATATPIP